MSKPKGDPKDPRGDDPPPDGLVDRVNEAIDRAIGGTQVS